MPTTTPAGTPYVQANDIVKQYPETSQSLAVKIDEKNSAQDTAAAGLRADVDATNARTAGWTRAGNGAQFQSGAGDGSVSVQTSSGYGTMMQSYAGNSEFWHRNGNTWYKFLTAYWATTGDDDMYVISSNEWNLANPNNFFAGTFFPAAGQATQQPAALRTTDDTPEGCYDLNATLLTMAAQIEALEARISELEAAQ